jgi:hypothetical protein
MPGGGSLPRSRAPIRRKCVSPLSPGCLTWIAAYRRTQISPTRRADHQRDPGICPDSQRSHRAVAGLRLRTSRDLGLGSQPAWRWQQPKGYDQRARPAARGPADPHRRRGRSHRGAAQQALETRPGRAGPSPAGQVSGTTRPAPGMAPIRPSRRGCSGPCRDEQPPGGLSGGRGYSQQAPEEAGSSASACGDAPQHWVPSAPAAASSAASAASQLRLPSWPQKVGLSSRTV